MNGFLNRFKPRTYQHQVVITFLSGTTRTAYQGQDMQKAEMAFLAAKSKYENGKVSIWSVSWYRDGVVYQIV